MTVTDPDQIARFDEWLLLLLRDPADRATPVGPECLEHFMVSMTALGSTSVLLMVAVLAAGFFVVAGDRSSAVVLMFASVGGALLSSGLKLYFARARPDLVPHLVEVQSASFPSGHAMKSTVVYLVLAMLIRRNLMTSGSRAYLLATAIGVSVLVGVSRIYLGVHWPSDVIAGWMFGAAWAAACVFIASRLNRALVGPRALRS